VRAQTGHSRAARSPRRRRRVARLDRRAPRSSRVSTCLSRARGRATRATREARARRDNATRLWDSFDEDAFAMNDDDAAIRGYLARLRDVEGEGDASAVDAQGVLVELKVRRRRRRRRKDDDLI
jgi:hypothetical protein